MGWHYSKNYSNVLPISVKNSIKTGRGKGKTRGKSFVRTGPDPTANKISVLKFQPLKFGPMEEILNPTAPPFVLKFRIWEGFFSKPKLFGRDFCPKRRLGELRSIVTVQKTSEFHVLTALPKLFQMALGLF